MQKDKYHYHMDFSHTDLKDFKDGYAATRLRVPLQTYADTRIVASTRNRRSRQSRSDKSL
jgi:hypothetical protein